MPIVKINTFGSVSTQYKAVNNGFPPHPGQGEGVSIVVTAGDQPITLTHLSLLIPYGDVTGGSSAQSFRLMVINGLFPGNVDSLSTTTGIVQSGVPDTQLAAIGGRPLFETSLNVRAINSLNPDSNGRPIFNFSHGGPTVGSGETMSILAVQMWNPNDAAFTAPTFMVLNAFGRGPIAGDYGVNAGGVDSHSTRFRSLSREALGG